MAASIKYHSIVVGLIMLLSVSTSRASPVFVALSSSKKCSIRTGAPKAPPLFLSLRRRQQDKLTTKPKNPHSITKRCNSRRTTFVCDTAIRDDNTSTIPKQSTTTGTESDENMIDNPIKSAGLSFISASSKSLGMLFYNIGGLDHKDIQALLLQAGTHLVNAGEYWSTDWSMVQDSILLASKAFYDISNVFGSANIDESLPLGTLFENISHELQDISNISGCCSLGPPCSVPNLLEIQENLIGVSIILKKNSVASTDEHMMATLFREVAELFGQMAGCHVDDVEGQTSEVTL